MRGANAINDSEFLSAYNDKTKTNADVISALDTDWTAVGVKLRSERLKLHTLVRRAGGAKGTFTVVPEAELAIEARIWRETGVVQQNPQTGSYVPMTDTGEYRRTGDQANEAGATVAATTETTTETTSSMSVGGATAAAPVDGTGSTDAQTSAQQPVAAPAKEVSFNVNIVGTPYKFSGPTIEDAQDGLFRKLRELDFAKVQISSARNGSPVGLQHFRDGGEYRITKQLTAASTHDELVEKARKALQDVFDDKSVGAEQTAESLGNLQDEIGTMIESLDV